MKLKKIMLLTLLLLAVLTIGTVSAAHDNFNETLTVDEAQETLNVSLDDDISTDYENPSGNDNVLGEAKSEDFTPHVTNEQVTDYYSNVVDLKIPDSINEGQMIVTVGFKNNNGFNISNMDVNSNFDAQAIYKFNVADIKSNYENGQFALSLYDLGFYRQAGDYGIDIKYNDGTNTVDIINSTLNVAFSDEIIININETSRYANALPFASVRVFAPISAYAELYIDEELYSHKNFNKGIVTFDSSTSWPSGVHTAELKVFDSELGGVLNSSLITFETLVGTDDVDVSFNNTVKENENVFISFNAPKSGEAFVKIDNADGKNYPLNKGSNTIDLGILDYGNHTIWISYGTTLDNGGVSFYSNYLNVFVGDDGHWLKLPEPLVLENDDTVKFAFDSDAKGNVTVTIDGVVVSNNELVNGSSEIKLTDFFTGENKYGQHTYNITYSGDATHDKLSKAGVFNVTYLFKDDIVREGMPYREYYPIIITLPGDANGTVTVNINGKTYTSNVNNGQATFKIPDLAMGEHDMIVSYSGDAKYPATSYKNILNVSYYGVVGDIKNNGCSVSLILPTNATGNLTVYNDNRGSKLSSVRLANGKATIDLTDLSVGKYEIRVVYEGNDYEVKQYSDEFDILPEIYIKQDIVIGETGQIFVDLQNASGHLLVLVEGVSPALIEIEGGVVNYTFDTEGLSKGNHTVNFEYFGNSFDGNIFYEVNKKTGYPMPINYNMHLLAKSPQVNMTPEDNWVIIDCGNATGTIEVFVDGVSAGVVDIVKGIARIDLSQFKDGNYNFSFVYSGDKIYDGFVKEMTVEVIHKVPSITAKNANVLYNAKGKYSVTVYDEKGSIVNGTQVSFVIGSMVYKTANTNAKGVATIVVGKNPGTYKVTVIALGVNVTKTLTVKHLLTLKKVTVKKSAKKLVLTATLAKVNKKYLKNKKITFKFNGKKYTAKTNKKGVAKVTIKSSVLKKLKVGKKVKYQATYLKDTVKKSAKIKK